jgi:antitoxin MazE
MLAKTMKWGNSLALRLPKAMARDCGIEENTPVEISQRDHEIVITPLNKGYSLDELLAGITPENIHHEIDMSGPVGKELL